MQDTASDESTKPRYDFSFAWESAYGRVLSLVQGLNLERSYVLDLGCGFASIADPLKELGYEYIGSDIDAEALERLAARGFEAHRLDLGEYEVLPDAIKAIAGGRKIALVLLLDVVEHMPETHVFLSALRAGIDLIDSPPLIVSVPNVAHVDIAAKLVFGRWDYMPTGLLDGTHLQFFTAERLERETSACGLIQLAANDFTLHDSDQHFPNDHPALHANSPIAQAIQAWRDSADPHSRTIQFIRAFMPCDVADRPSEKPDYEDVAAPALTVLMRTQGRRLVNLREALTCLAAQTVDTFSAHNSQGR